MIFPWFFRLFKIPWFFHAWNFFLDFPGFPWFPELMGTLLDGRWFGTTITWEFLDMTLELKAIVFEYYAIFNTNVFVMGPHRLLSSKRPKWASLWDFGTYHIHMGESSNGWKYKIWKILNFRKSNLKTCSIPMKHNGSNGQWSLDKLKINQRSYYNLLNSAFWGWLPMESKSQNPE